MASLHYPLVATLTGSTLNIYETPLARSHNLEYAHPVNQITLDPTFATEIRSISFSPHHPVGPRILLASTTTVHVYSALPEPRPFHASILNAASPSTSLHNASFLTAEEVILVPELAPRITIRDVTTGLGIELRDAKHTGTNGSLSTQNAPRICGYSIRCSGHVAFLTRPSVGKDLIVVFVPRMPHSDGLGRRDIEVEFLVATSDALGLSFSSNGTWLAVWDTPTAKTNPGSSSDLASGAVYIYTTTGTLYKQFNDFRIAEKSDLSLGIERIQWLADNRLAVATIDGCVLILAAETFEREAIIRHPKVFETASDDYSIYVEQIAAESGARNYAAAVLPAAPPAKKMKSTTEISNLPRGVTHLASSADGLLLASVCAHTPTAVQITALENDRTTVRAVLIHHATVQTIEWHPTKAGWLLIRTTQERSYIADTVYTWSSNLPEPMVVTASLPTINTVRASSLEPKSSTSSSASIHISWLVPPQESSPDAIPDILFSFPTATISVSALPLDESLYNDSFTATQLEDETPTRQQPIPAHKLTEKTPIKGTGWEPAFDQSFENLRAESLAQSLSESVTDGGFSPVKFDATDWTRKQFMGEPDGEQDDTFVGKGRQH